MPRLILLASAALALWAGPGTPAARGASEPRPNVLLVVIDTLRADRLSAYGYERSTSPHIDRLLSRGVRFTQARTDEPLTGPAMCSVVTSLPPQEHGASRNGLKMRPRLPSFVKLLRRSGYRTAAFVGNWTLRDRNTGLGEHFDRYEEVFTRKRWFGLFSKEATGQDLTDTLLEWLGEHREEAPQRPFFAWVQYVEPHAPYRLQERFAPALGIATSGAVSRSDRYDTEVAFSDYQVGRVLDGLAELGIAEDTLVIFTSDHGESLGEHGYWGHGRHVYEPTLRVPLGITWPGRLPAGTTVDAPVTLTDLGPTLLGLLELPALDLFQGYDWSGVLTGDAEPPEGRVTFYQAHKGAVLGSPEARRSRINGLLEVARVADGKKETLRVGNGDRRLFDLAADPLELESLVPQSSEPSAELADWLAQVEEGLRLAGNLPAADLDDESAEKLKALGYVD